MHPVLGCRRCSNLHPVKQRTENVFFYLGNGVFGSFWTRRVRKGKLKAKATSLVTGFGMIK